MGRTWNRAKGIRGPVKMERMGVAIGWGVNHRAPHNLAKKI
jgi:hypothetical protein